MFDHVIDGMFRKSLGSRLTPACKAELKAAGLDLSQPLRPAYPLDDYFTFLEIAGKHLYPDKTAPQALYALGAGFVDGYHETLMGRAILQLARIIGPSRAVKRSTQTWRQGNNFTDVKVVERTPTCFELHFNLVGRYAEHTQGALYGALAVNSDLEVSVEILRREGQGAVYLVQWSPKPKP